MTVEHVLFIPGVFLIGLAFGWVFGIRAAKDEEARKRDARKR